jgi:putative endonuclease
MYYVYIIQSQVDKSYYKGFTSDLKNQFDKHNRGGQMYTAKKKPFDLVWYCAFKEKSKALAFEKYLKIGSGFAFSKKHLI